MRAVTRVVVVSGVFTSVALAAAVVGLSAQGSVFRSRTELAVLNISVTDRQGHVVADLAADRFEVREDNAPRPVAALTTGVEPLSLLIAVDASESMAGSRFQAAREAVKAFFAARRPDDEYFVLGFNDRVFPIAPGSQSGETIQGMLEHVTPVGTTALYAAITTAVDSLRTALNRRRAIVIVSDGRDSTVLGLPPSLAFERQTRVGQRIERSEALVYSIGIDAPVKGKVVMPDHEFDANALRHLTDPTGGVTYVVRSDAAVPDAAATIIADLRSQYVLGFEPAHPGDGKFHRVTVRVSGCDCRVRTRRGYVALPADSR